MLTLDPEFKLIMTTKNLKLKPKSEDNAIVIKWRTVLEGKSTE
jgi:hypothetical protein